MYYRARLRRNSSTTSSKVVPALANLRASVRVLMARFFAILCLRALPCGSNFCASFSTKARKVPGAVSRCLAASSQIGRRVSSKWMSSVMRGKARLRLEKTSRSEEPPNSTGQPQNRSNSGKPELRVWTKVIFVGATFRPVISRRLFKITVIPNSVFCPARNRGTPTKWSSTTKSLSRRDNFTRKA